MRQVEARLNLSYKAGNTFEKKSDVFGKKSENNWKLVLFRKSIVKITHLYHMDVIIHNSFFFQKFHQGIVLSVTRYISLIREIKPG